jgi:hypothetical protein
VTTVQTALRSAVWIVLGGWLGAWVLFAVAVAPTAFAELPSAELAGRVVGPVLGALHRYGIGAGLALAALAAALRRGRMLVSLPVLLAALCAVSEFGITPAIHAARLHAFGTAADAESAARFARLHVASTALYGLVGLGALSLIVLHVRAERPQAPWPRAAERANRP